MQNGTFHVFPECRHQQVTDFGASACWWSTELGHMEQVDEYLDLLYGPKGLGLNVLRINVGGGVRDDRSDSFPASIPRSPYSPLDENGLTHARHLSRSSWAAFSRSMTRCRNLEHSTLLLSTRFIWSLLMARECTALFLIIS